jgi:hypothetical protein
MDGSTLKLTKSRLYWAKLKADPERFKRITERQKAYRRADYAELKKDPHSYRVWRDYENERERIRRLDPEYLAKRVKYNKYKPGKKARDWAAIKADPVRHEAFKARRREEMRRKREARK